MDSLLNRYRNVTFLVLAIMAQLVLLAYQVKTGNDVRLIRVWAVTAVTPLANAIEWGRSGVANFWGNYVTLRDTREQNRAMREELGKLKMENQFLRNELSTAERARALSVFQSRTPSRTLAARVIAAGAGSGSHVVFIDRGSGAGVMKGMAVVTPDGIAGKVIAAYPTASQVSLITDPSFGAGVISQKNRVRGILKGQGYAICLVDRVQSEMKVEPGEWFYTSGDDRVFPKGMPVGRVRSVKAGAPFQEILVEPSALQGGLEEVLILLEGVHQQIPELPVPSSGMYVLPPPPADAVEGEAPVTEGPGTDADRLRDRYKAVGAAQGHVFGEGGPGSRPPDFNAQPAPAGAVAPAAGTAPAAGAPATGTPKPQSGVVAQPGVATPGAAAASGVTRQPVVAAPAKPQSEVTNPAAPAGNGATRLPAGGAAPNVATPKPQGATTPPPASGAAKPSAPVPSR